MASESSSEDENLEKFSEIVQCATLGLQQTVNNNSATSSTCATLQNMNAKKQSLRCWREEQELVESSNNSITPEVKRHMARKLTKYLDSAIKWRDNNNSTVQIENVCKSPEEEIGVYLLSSSKTSLQSVDEKVVQPSNKRTYSPSTSSDSSDDNEMARLAEAAVSGYTIMKNGNSSGKQEDNKVGKRESTSEEELKEHSKVKKKRKKKKKERDKD